MMNRLARGECSYAFVHFETRTPTKGMQCEEVEEGGESSSAHDRMQVSARHQVEFEVDAADVDIG